MEPASVWLRNVCLRGAPARGFSPGSYPALQVTSVSEALLAPGLPGDPHPGQTLRLPLRDLCALLDTALWRSKGYALGGVPPRQADLGAVARVVSLTLLCVSHLLLWAPSSPTALAAPLSAERPLLLTYFPCPCRRCVRGAGGPGRPALAPAWGPPPCSRAAPQPWALGDRRVPRRADRTACRLRPGIALALLELLLSLRVAGAHGAPAARPPLGQSPRGPHAASGRRAFLPLLPSLRAALVKVPGGPRPGWVSCLARWPHPARWLMCCPSCGQILSSLHPCFWGLWCLPHLPSGRPCTWPPLYAGLLPCEALACVLTGFRKVTRSSAACAATQTPAHALPAPGRHVRLLCQSPGPRHSHLRVTLPFLPWSGHVCVG